jgi:tRNA uridine 5-carboxymethylaminomethyl modification enzyme
VLVSLRADRIGEMSCNPAIGGLGKGQLVREVDALGGVMGLAADAHRHPVQDARHRQGRRGAGAALPVGPPPLSRGRHAHVLEALPNVRVVEGAATGSSWSTRAACGRGPRRAARRRARARRRRGRAHDRDVPARGDAHRRATSPGGRVGERAAGCSVERLRASDSARPTEDRHAAAPRSRLDRLGPHSSPAGDDAADAVLVRSARGFPNLPQVACRDHADTTPRTHALIRANVHRAPMYAGRITGVGPALLPVGRGQGDALRRQGLAPDLPRARRLSTDVIYVNGVSTSLPATCRRSSSAPIPGLERARFLRHGYAVEYDFVAADAARSARSRPARVPGLFLAGQINGTSGYEEAAAQGSSRARTRRCGQLGRAAFVLARDEAYIGVLVDDLVVAQPTSRTACSPAARSIGCCCARTTPTAALTAGGGGGPGRRPESSNGSQRARGSRVRAARAVLARRAALAEHGATRRSRRSCGAPR